MNARVVILGAGPAGIRAAQRLVEAGLRPIVIDEQSRAGGQIYRRPDYDPARSYAERYGTEHAKAKGLHEAFDSFGASVEHLSGATAWAVHDGAVYIERNGQSEAIGYDRLIIATGAIERVLPVKGWTAPGCFSLGGAQISLKAQGCAIGEAVAFVGTGPLLYLVALQYAQAGAKVVGVFDTSPLHLRIRNAPAMLAKPGLLLRGLGMMMQLRLSYRIPIKTGVRPVEIVAGGGVQAFRYDDAGGVRHEATCSAVAIGYDLRPETQIADLAGCEMAYDPQSRNWHAKADPVGRTSRAGVYVAGDGHRIAGADAAEIAGQLAALAVLEDLGRPGRAEETAGLLKRAAAFRRFRKGLENAFPPPVGYVAALDSDVVLCRCENISVGTYKRIAQEMDARDVNRAKSMSRCGMGRCQGRYCEFAAAEILARQLGVERGAVGRLRAQPPVKPISGAMKEVGCD